MIDPKTRILDTIVTSVTARDHWIEIGGSWKINRERVMSSFVAVNGQEIKGMVL